MSQNVYKTLPQSTIILLHKMNDLKVKSTPNKVANNIISLEKSVGSDENCVFCWPNNHDW